MNADSFYVANVQRAADGCIHALTMAQKLARAAIARATGAAT